MGSWRKRGPWRCPKCRKEVIGSPTCPHCEFGKPEEIPQRQDTLIGALNVEIANLREELEEARQPRKVKCHTAALIPDGWRASVSWTRMEGWSAYGNTRTAAKRALTVRLKKLGCEPEWRD